MAFSEQMQHIVKQKSRNLESIIGIELPLRSNCNRINQKLENGKKNKKLENLTVCNVLEAVELAGWTIKLRSNPFKKMWLLVVSCESDANLFG